MKLNPCTTCKSDGEFVVNNDLTAIACRECGQRTEISDIYPGDVFEAWNKYNPLPANTVPNAFARAIEDIAADKIAELNLYKSSSKESDKKTSTRINVHAASGVSTGFDYAKQEARISFDDGYLFVEHRDGGWVADAIFAPGIWAWVEVLE